MLPKRIFPIAVALSTALACGTFSGTSDPNGGTGDASPPGKSDGSASTSDSAAGEDASGAHDDGGEPDAGPILPLTDTGDQCAPNATGPALLCTDFRVGLCPTGAYFSGSSDAQFFAVEDGASNLGTCDGGIYFLDAAPADQWFTSLQSIAAPRSWIALVRVAFTGNGTATVLRFNESDSGQTTIALDEGNAYVTGPKNSGMAQVQGDFAHGVALSITMASTGLTIESIGAGASAKIPFSGTGTPPTLDTIDFGMFSAAPGTSVYFDYLVVNPPP